VKIEEVGDRILHGGRKFIAFKKLDWTLPAVEKEDRVPVRATGMNMGRGVVLRKDLYAEVAEAQDGRHPVSLRPE
jgi:hypothetical protein